MSSFATHSSSGHGYRRIPEVSRLVRPKHGTDGAKLYPASRFFLNKTFQFGIIGLGRIGQRHAHLIHAHPEARLKAIVEPTGFDLADALLPEDIPVYDSMEDFLAAAPVLDVVCVCTPTGQHPAQCQALLKAGYHVLCEKPMGLNRRSCEEVIHAAMQSQRQFFCVMQNRYTPIAQWLKQLVEDGRLGSIYQIVIHCFWNRDERYYGENNWRGRAGMDGGPLYTQFSHFIDILYWVFGDIHSIHGQFADFRHQESTDFEDSGQVQFRLYDHPEALGALHYSTAVWDQNQESSITVIAENGSLKIGGQYMNALSYCHLKDIETPNLEAPQAPNQYGPYQGSAANHHFVIQNVIDTLKQQGQAMTNALEGMKVVDIIERIYQCEGYRQWESGADKRKALSA